MKIYEIGRKLQSYLLTYICRRRADKSLDMFALCSYLVDAKMIGDVEAERPVCRKNRELPGGDHPQTLENK
jgi:hypothetical protein